jgi:hypothetical protein
LFLRGAGQFAQRFFDQRARPGPVLGIEQPGGLGQHLLQALLHDRRTGLLVRGGGLHRHDRGLDLVLEVLDLGEPLADLRLEALGVLAVVHQDQFVLFAGLGVDLHAVIGLGQLVACRERVRHELEHALEALRGLHIVGFVEEHAAHLEVAPGDLGVLFVVVGDVGAVQFLGCGLRDRRCQRQRDHREKKKGVTDHQTPRMVKIDEKSRKIELTRGPCSCK